VGVIFLRRCDAGNMMVLGDNGRNRIAAPTHGHQWRARLPQAGISRFPFGDIAAKSQVVVEFLA